jgi:hypothetical protein
MDESKVNTDALVNHLRDKWQGRPCPLCGQGNWNVENKAFELREFAGGTLVAGRPVMPVIPAVCWNSGNTVSINAIVAGAVKPEPSSTETTS